MADAQYLHAEKMAKGEGKLSGQTFRGKAIRLERRICIGRFNFANISDCLWSF